MFHLEWFNFLSTKPVLTTFHSLLDPRKFIERVGTSVEISKARLKRRTLLGLAPVKFELTINLKVRQICICVDSAVLFNWPGRTERKKFEIDSDVNFSGMPKLMHKLR